MAEDRRELAGPTAGVLAGLRVVELADMIAGPYVTKLLGDLGAEVVKLESPDGDPSRRVGPFVGGQRGDERSILFLHLNTSKRGVCLDLGQPDQAALAARLIGRADLLVTDRHPDDLGAVGLSPEHLGIEDRRLVVLSLTPFGWQGPHRHYRSTPFTTFHGAGEGYLTPVASHLMPEVVDRPPLRQGRFAAEYKLATYAATLALAAVFHARATGTGQMIDLSKQDALIGLNFFEFAGWLSTGAVPTRASLAVPFGGIMRCADGYLQFTFHEEHQWRALVRQMGDPTWAQEEWASTEASRVEHAEEINARLGEWLATLTREEVVRGGQAAGVTVAPYHGIDEVAASAQLAERGYFVPVEHPVVGPGRYPTGPWRFSGSGPQPGAAPTLGQDNEAVLGGLLGLSAGELARLSAAAI